MVASSCVPALKLESVLPRVLDRLIVDLEDKAGRRGGGRIEPRLHVVGCQLEPVRAFICGARVVVSGPRSFSKTTPL